MQITSEAIIIGNELYPVKNIASARMVERSVKVRRSILGYLLPLAAVIGLAFLVPQIDGLYYQEWFRSSPLAVLYDYQLAIYGVLAVLFVLLLKNTHKTVTEYGIELNTNAGRSSLLFSRDRDFIAKVRDLIFTALRTDKHGVSYTVNVDNSTIHNNVESLTITIEKIDFNHHTGLSPEQLSFLQTDFNRALVDMAKQLQASGESALLEEVKALRAQLAQPAPDAGKLRRHWAHVKGVAEVCGVGDNVLGIINNGIQFFT